MDERGMPSNTTPAPSPTSAHSSFNLQISVSLAFCPQDGRVQFASEYKNGSDHVEKDECDHHRRETRVGGDIIAREFGEEGTEGNARGDPHGGGQQNSGSNVAQRSSPGWQKLMRKDKRQQKHQARDRETAEGDQPVERLKTRREVQRGHPDQGREHNKESKRQKRESANENIGDGLKPQQPPRPRVPDVVRAVEPGPDCFDAARRKIDRQNDAYREETAPLLRQDIVDLVRNGCRYLGWPGLQ